MFFSCSLVLGKNIRINVDSSKVTKNSLLPGLNGAALKSHPKLRNHFKLFKCLLHS